MLENRLPRLPQSQLRFPHDRTRLRGLNNGSDIFSRLVVFLTTSSLEIVGIALAIVVAVIIIEAVSFAGIAAGDLKRARR